MLWPNDAEEIDKLSDEHFLMVGTGDGSKPQKILNGNFSGDFIPMSGTNADNPVSGTIHLEPGYGIRSSYTNGEVYFRQNGGVQIEAQSAINVESLESSINLNTKGKAFYNGKEIATVDDVGGNSSRYYTYDSANEIAKIIPYYRSEDGQPYSDPFSITGYGFGNSQYQFYDHYVSMKLRYYDAPFFLKDYNGYLGLFANSNDYPYDSSIELNSYTGNVLIRNNGKHVLYSTPDSFFLSHNDNHVFVANNYLTKIRHTSSNNDILSATESMTQILCQGEAKFVANHNNVFINLYGHGKSSYDGAYHYEAVFQAGAYNTQLRYMSQTIDEYNRRLYNVILEAGQNSSEDYLAIYCGNVAGSGNSDTTHSVIQAYPGILTLGVPNTDQTEHIPFIQANTRSSNGTMYFYDAFHPTNPFMEIYNYNVYFRYTPVFQNTDILISGISGYSNLASVRSLLNDLRSRVSALESAS
jgi:hypothetical protein